MTLFRKLLFFTITFFVVFLGVNSTFAQQTFTDTTNLAQQYYQPTPRIISPQENSTVKDIVAINISIQPTVVQKMEVYLNTTFLGMAKPLDSVNWVYNFDTKNFPNNQYTLMIRSTITTTTGYPIDTFSPAVPITISNTTSIIPKTTTKTAVPTATQSQEETQANTSTTTTAANTTATNDTGTVENQTETKKTSAAPPQSTEKELATESKDWQVVSTISFPKKSASQLTKIEYKINKSKKEYLVFSGIAAQDSQVNLRIYSDPIVITTRADSKGNWEYIFEKPLEPGQHRVEVDIISSKGVKATSGPFNFLIARAQASADNPTGANLQLVDPMGQAYLYYALAATVLIFIALIVLLFIRAQRRKKMKGESV